MKDVADDFRSFTDTERLEGFSLRNLFADAFNKHSTADIERQFCVGTPGTIPDISDVDTAWPRPWMFLRALLGSGIVYSIFLLGWHLFENVNLLPGLIMTGSLMFPISTVILFFEVNARRNVSLYQVLRMVMLGGVIALLFSLVLFASPLSVLGWMGDSLAGVIEEPGKLLALLFAARSARYHYKLNGLLFGACVGAGFAVFESMGYSFRILLQADTLGEVTSNIFLRGVLSPLGHVVWTAIAGAAMWRVKGKSSFRLEMVKDRRFWRLFIVPVVLHMMWNLDIELPFYAKYLGIGLVGWFVALSLMQEGLKELKIEKASCPEHGA